MPTESAAALEFDATLLPSGMRQRFWVKDGRITFAPQADAERTRSGGFVLAGMVDAHTHADYPQGPAPEDRDGFVRRNLREFTGVGVLLLRDMGASSTLLEDLPRHDDEPRVIPAGKAMVGFDNRCFPTTAEDQALSHALAQLRPGVQWLKIFVDFPDPSSEAEGKEPYFKGDNPLTYSPELLQELVQAVHARGGRVAAHVFSEAGARASVAAGADTLEHGWGVTEDLFDEMRAKNIAWVPLVAIAEPMQALAKRDGRPDQLEWIVESLQRLTRTLPAAVAAGVTLLTGSDWFPMIGVRDEVVALMRLGVPGNAALDAATDAARRYLGHRTLEEGSPADLLWYESDPRETLPPLPDLILLDGKEIPAVQPPPPIPRSGPHPPH
ncbi:MAG: amidohydrolase family protein [Polyangiaceae bacterium]